MARVGLSNAEATCVTAVSAVNTISPVATIAIISLERAVWATETPQARAMTSMRVESCGAPINRHCSCGNVALIAVKVSMKNSAGQ